MKLICTALALVLNVFLFAAQAAPRPNVVLFLADDLGWADVGFHGSDIRTPHLDELAERGTTLTQFYVQPTCTPTRVALMTGRYPFRTGAHFCVLRPYHEHGIPLEERFISEMMRDAGYKTAITGKWHLGLARKAYWPTSRGFDLQYGHLGGAIGYFDHKGYGSLDWQDNDHRPLREEGYATDLIGQRAVKIVREHDFDAQPLFLYVPFNAPHTPLDAKPEDMELYAHIEDKKRRAYAAMIHAMDVQMGEVVKVIEERGQADNTIIFFASDNGGASGPPDNRPWRGRKGTLFEGGMRVPTVMVWPGQLEPGSRFDQLAHIVDLFPTFAHLAGGDPDAGLPLNGVNLWSALTEGTTLPERDLYHNVINDTGRGAIRSGPWKLIANRPNVLSDGIEVPGEKWAVALFNLDEDPYETINVAAQQPEKLHELWDKLKAMGPEVASYADYCTKAPEGWVAPPDWSSVPD